MYDIAYLLILLTQLGHEDYRVRNTAHIALSSKRHAEILFSLVEPNIESNIRRIWLQRHWLEKYGPLPGTYDVYYVVKQDGLLQSLWPATVISTNGDYSKIRVESNPMIFTIEWKLVRWVKVE